MEKHFRGAGPTLRQKNTLSPSAKKPMKDRQHLLENEGEKRSVENWGVGAGTSPGNGRYLQRGTLSKREAEGKKKKVRPRVTNPKNYQKKRTETHMRQFSMRG